MGELRCPECGETNLVRLDLDDMTTFSCDGCESGFAPSDVAAMFAEWDGQRKDWERVLDWIKTAPLKE